MLAGKEIAMASTFVDDKRAAQGAVPANLRGLLSVPPAVSEHVEGESLRAQKEHGFALTSEAKQRMLNQGTLDWFYRDQWVSYRDTPQGVEVLGVGLEEVGELARNLTAEQRLEVITKLV
jgi:hypothetical protein